MFNGVSHLLAVEPTPAGQARFEADVRRIFNLGPHEQLQLTWSCRLPGTGEELQLEGSEAFGAAAHLASLSAGQRLQREQAAGAAAAAPAGAASTASPGPGSPTPGSRLRRSRWFG